jgi:hypothetical protein
MKFLKAFENFEISLEETFSEEEFYEIKDIYIDLVDDLNLTDVDREGQMTKPMKSNLSYFSKMSGEKFKIDISIRTADLIDYTDYDSYAVPNQEDRERYNLVMKELEPFIDTLKSRGYQIYKRDINIKLDSWKYITAGIKISITK